MSMVSSFSFLLFSFRFIATWWIEEKRRWSFSAAINRWWIIMTVGTERGETKWRKWNNNDWKNELVHAENWLGAGWAVLMNSSFIHTRESSCGRRASTWKKCSPNLKLNCNDWKVLTDKIPFTLKYVANFSLGNEVVIALEPMVSVLSYVGRVVASFNGTDVVDHSKERIPERSQNGSITSCNTFSRTPSNKVYMFSVDTRGLCSLSARSVAELTLLLMLRRWDMNGLMSRYSGKAMNDEIFLWNRLECSKRCTQQQYENSCLKIRYRNDSGEHTFKWKLATIGSFFIVSCLVDSW